MKWAVFSFAQDNGCDVGETDWIQGEQESESFNNNDWDFSKEVIVKWPKKKSGKSINDGPDTTSHVATIIQFSDDKDTVLQYLQRFVDTGSTKTPVRGRQGGKSQRVPKRNAKYESGDEDSEDEPRKPIKKKGKVLKTKKDEMISMIRSKFDMENSGKVVAGSDRESDEQSLFGQEESQVDILRREIANLKKENHALKEVIVNMKALPNLVSCLKETITIAKELSVSVSLANSNQTQISRTSVPASRVVMEKPSSPAVQSVTPSCSSWKSSVNSTSESDESPDDMVTIHPGIVIHRGQMRILDLNSNPKTYVYVLMQILWTRDVLATHSLTGKSSNAHKDKEAKPCLDPLLVASLCDLVCKKFRVREQEVKGFIKSKLNNVEKCQKMKK